MSIHKTSSDIRGIQEYLGKLEKELDDVRCVISILLEKVSLEPGEREELASRLAVEPMAGQELSPEKVQFEKTIQQLLDESEQPGR